MTQLIEFAGNHLILVGALFFLLTMLIVNLLQGSGSGSVMPIQAVQLLNRDEAVALDIRSAADFNSGHIINAINVPLADLKEKIGELEKYRERPILVYCASGMTSATALKDLSAAGFEKVHSLKGGIAAWRADKLPVA